MGFSSDNGIMLSRPKPSGNDSTVQDATRKLNLVPNLGMHVRMRVKRRSEECLPIVQLEMVSATYIPSHLITFYLMMLSPTSGFPDRPNQ